MSSTTLDIKLRPLKFAFIVDPSRPESVLEAIQVNSFLWGGSYNPIIPMYRKIPSYLAHSYEKKLSVSDILTGYLDNFDPDVLVPIGVDGLEKFTFPTRKVISISDLIHGSRNKGISNMGVGVFEILRSLIRTELKFVRRDPLKFSMPICKGENEIFFASVFGMLSPDQTQFFHKHFDKDLDARWIDCSFINYIHFFEENNLFLRRITNHGLRANGYYGGKRGNCIFLLDASKVVDIIDYWNLRAIGWQVFPVPIQAELHDTLLNYIHFIIKENCIQDQNNPDYFHNEILIKSRSLNDETAMAFITSLNLPKTSKPYQTMLTYQSWYPRMWDEWALSRDGVKCCDLVAGKARTDISDALKGLNFTTVAPEFMVYNYSSAEARYANEVNLRSYGEKELVAEVIPECNDTMTSVIGGLSPREWRFGKKSIVYFAHYRDWSVRLRLPLAEEVIVKWLKSKDWNVKLSAAGLITKQMLLQLGGTFGVSWLSNEALVKFLIKMSNGKSMLANGFFAEFTKISQAAKLPIDTSIMLRSLMKTEMFRLGFELQCPACTQFTWYSVDVAGYELQCEKCLSKFQLPSHSPKDIKWSYRTLGPFSLASQSAGVYPVLLTLRFFASVLDGATTPLLSSEFKNGKEHFEVDLTILFQKFRILDTKTETVFCECKAEGTFEKKDIDRMRILARYFPGSILVLSTIRKSLKESEKRLLRGLANTGRRYWKAGRPYNAVLILTGTELFSEWGPPYCWKDAGGAYAELADKYHDEGDLLSLCDATQQLYLDMKPWHQWLEERRIKRSVSKLDSKLNR